MKTGRSIKGLRQRLSGLAILTACLVGSSCAPATPGDAPATPGELPSSNPSSVVATSEEHLGYRTWKIQAANGIWYFQVEHAETHEPATGFSSAIDEEGNDWIGNDCVENREWRGWPNFGPDGFGHPCRGGDGMSRFIDENGEPIEGVDPLEDDHLILESWNDNYRVRYHFFPSHGVIEVIEASALYAFLFEGPVAGEMNVEKQYYVLEDGEQRRFEAGGLGYLDPEFGRNFPSPFFYFVDEDAEQVLYVGATGQSSGGDEGWVQPTNMVIFSFGREDDKHALTGSGALSVFGFLDKNMGHEQIKASIIAHLENPFD